MCVNKYIVHREVVEVVEAIRTRSNCILNVTVFYVSY